MTVARIAISLDTELARALREAAKDQPLSTWMADAARRKLRAEGMMRVIEDWEAKHGELSQRELEAAARARGRPRKLTARPARPAAKTCRRRTKLPSRSTR